MKARKPAVRCEVREWPRRGGLARAGGGPLGANWTTVALACKISDRSSLSASLTSPLAQLAHACERLHSPRRRPSCGERTPPRRCATATGSGRRTARASARAAATRAAHGFRRRPARATWPLSLSLRTTLHVVNVVTARCSLPAYPVLFIQSLQAIQRFNRAWHLLCAQ